MIFSSQALSARKQRVSKSLDQVLSDQDWLIVFAGEPIHKPGGHDQTYPFLPHPDYFWLTGSRRPYGVSVYTKHDGWVDFVLPITKEERVWEGGGETISGRALKEFESYIAKASSKNIFLLGQYQHKQTLSGVSEESRLKVQEAFNRVRRIKDQEEVDLVIKIAHMANKGYQKVKSVIAPGMTERQIQIEYETEVLRAGAEKLPYDTIVGTGTNSAILHAIPTMRILKSGEHVLIDAGADVQDYCVDITRNFPVNGEFDERQKAIYNLVLKAQSESIEFCRPGLEWREAHLTSARVMAQGLRDLNILTCSAEEAIATGAISVFFPHGVGHMVGLRVRDVGGPHNPNPKKYAGARLRVDMPLEEGHLMTVEPGLYFIEALISDEEVRSTFKSQINWAEVEKWKSFGGFRIEDDILVTASGPKNLTAMVDK